MAEEDSQDGGELLVEPLIVNFGGQSLHLTYVHELEELLDTEASFLKRVTAARKVHNLEWASQAINPLRAIIETYLENRTNENFKGLEQKLENYPLPSSASEAGAFLTSLSQRDGGPKVSQGALTFLLEGPPNHQDGY